MHKTALVTGITGLDARSARRWEKMLAKSHERVKRARPALKDEGMGSGQRQGRAELFSGDWHARTALAELNRLLADLAECLLHNSNRKNIHSVNKSKVRQATRQ